MRTKNHNHMMHGSWGIEWDRQNFLSFWAIFCPITHLAIPRISIFKKWKKNNKNNNNNNNAWRLIILHMCTINDNHIVYNSWDTERNRQNFLLFCVIFCPFTKLTTQKIKILKKWNINILQMRTINNNHMMYGYWDSEHDWHSSLSFWAIFCPFIPLTTQKNQN